MEWNIQSTDSIQSRHGKRKMDLASPKKLRAKKEKSLRNTERERENTIRFGFYIKTQNIGTERVFERTNNDNSNNNNSSESNNERAASSSVR